MYYRHPKKDSDELFNNKLENNFKILIKSASLAYLTTSTISM